MVTLLLRRHPLTQFEIMNGRRSEVRERGAFVTWSSRLVMATLENRERGKGPHGNQNEPNQEDDPRMKYS